ncbi:MAG: pantoate--beta-alanine ligase [Pseudomonadota bacterium]
MSLPRTIISLNEMLAVSRDWKKAGDTIAFIPTMGALHEGHLALMQYAESLASKIVVSIFVNPSQFGPNEDFSKYPRTLRDDLEKIKHLKIDAVFTPNASEIYPPDFQTWVDNSMMSLDFCGPFRPQHFRGVATIVLKLFHLVDCDHAIFGKKDYQQVKIIEQMVHDLNMPITIHPMETIREEDGLALSSRNRFLDESSRHVSLALPVALNVAFDMFQSGVRSRSEIENAFASEIARYPEIQLEYGKVANQSNLRRDGDEITEASVFLAAVRVGGVRLIDNLELGQ